MFDDVEWERKKYIDWRDKMIEEMKEDFCQWHEGESPWPPDEPPPYCDLCGRILWTKQCSFCLEYFLDYGARGFDDVCGAVYVALTGDVVCAFCGPHEDEMDEYEF